MLSFKPALSRVHLFATPWTVAPRLLCPWDFPENTGVGGHSLLQGNFLTQGLNPHLLHPLFGRWIFDHCSTWEAKTDIISHQCQDTQPDCVSITTASPVTVQGQERPGQPGAGSSGVCAEGHLPVAKHIRQTYRHQAGPSATQRGRLRHADVTAPTPAWARESQRPLCGTGRSQVRGEACRTHSPRRARGRRRPGGSGHVL